MKNEKFIVFSLLFFIAFFLRFYKFTELPPLNGFGFEEFQTGEYALLLLQNRTFLFSQSFALEHLLTNSLPAFTFGLFGADAFNLRLPFVIIGSLTIPIFYLLAREITTPFVAIFSSFLFLVARWHIFGSRIADELFTGIFIETLLLLFFVKAIKSGKSLYYLLTGILTGLCAYEYFGYRIALILVPAVMMILFIKSITDKRRNFISRLRNTIVFFIAAAVVCYPLLSVFANGNDLLIEGIRRNANARLGGGFTPLSMLIRENPFGILPNHEIIQDRILPTFKVFFLQGSGIPELGSNIPLLDPVTGILFILGYVYTLLSLRKPWRFIVFAWVTIALIVGAFFPVNFYPGRFTVIMPFIFLLIGFLFNDVGSFLLTKQKGKILLVGAATVLILFVATHNLHTLFVRQAHDASVFGVFNAKRDSSLCSQKRINGWICDNQGYFDK